MSEESVGCGSLLIVVICVLIGVYIGDSSGTNSLDFNGYRVCLENSKPEYCNTQFKDVHEFLKKNKLKLEDNYVKCK